MTTAADMTRLTSIDPPTNIKRLEHLFAIEKLLMRVQGARLPDLESWFLKQKIGYHIFEDANHADALRTRRLELRAGTRGFAVLDARLRTVIEQCLFAEGDYLFGCALYLGFKPLLVQTYRQLLDDSTIISDHPSRQVIELLIADEERQISWMSGALALMGEVTADQKKQGHEWVRQMQVWVKAAGGIMGDGEPRPDRLPEPRAYQVTRRARRERRQKATFNFEAPVYSDDVVEQATLSQFTAYFREMAAAETMAALLWQAPEEMPWEFFRDSARHFWDEIRHCQVGQQRLEELGIDIWEVPVQTGHYDCRAHMPLLESYAYLTQVQEAGSFAIKRTNEELFRKAGDSLSADMVAYDMADERNHVRYGTRWIPELQKVLGDTRSMDELVDDACRIQQQTWQQLSGQAYSDESGTY